MASESDLRSTLNSILRSSTAANIQSCLTKSLAKASPEHLKALSVLLAPLSSEASISKHCVRCHQEYRENENHGTACKIKHNEFGECERTVIGYEEMTMTVSCCGISFDADDGPPRNNFCIVEFHTTDPDQVVYYDEDENEEDSDSDNGINEINENVITCSKAGCSKKRKQASPAGSSRASKMRK